MRSRSCTPEAGRSSSPPWSTPWSRSWRPTPPDLPDSAGMSDAELACLDGRTLPASEAAIPVTDEGFLRGDGVFEVIRVYDGQPFALQEHLDRLQRSARNLHLGWDAPRS